MLKCGVWKYPVLVIACLAGLLAGAASYGQDTQKQEGGFAFEIMKSSFSSLNNPAETYVEIYLTLLPVQYNFIQREDGKYYAFLEIDVVIKDNDDAVVDKQTWKRVLNAANAEEIQGQAIVDMANFLLAPGNYNLFVTVADLSTKKSTTSPPDILSVPRYLSSILSQSDIEFASVIRAAGAEKNFVKHNAYYVEPYPSRIYSNARPHLYFYSEVYNLGTPVNEEDLYERTIQILNSSGAQVYLLTNEFKKPESGLAVIAERVNVLKLPNDLYTLLITVTDMSTGISAEKKGTFYVYKPNEVISTVIDPALQLDITPNNVGEYRNQLEYLLTPAEQKQFGSLNFDQKKKFIEDFWKNRDSAFMKEHLRRYKFATDTYTALGVPGWRSDRGKIYILFGKPSNLDQFPSDPGLLPYEIWTYERIKEFNQVQFVFADLTEFGNYELMHSTYSGSVWAEKYNPDWQSQIIR